MKSFFIVVLFCCGCAMPSGSQVKVKATCFNVLSPYPTVEVEVTITKQTVKTEKKRLFSLLTFTDKEL
jgi:hypothetical protein